MVILSKIRASCHLAAVCGAFLTVFMTTNGLVPKAYANSFETNHTNTVLVPGQFPPFPGHVHDADHLGKPNFFEDTDSFCGTDLSSESSRLAVRSYLEARNKGLLPRLAKSLIPPVIGDERSFNVNESGWEGRTFRLIDITTEYYLWMDLDVIPQTTNFDKDSFRTQMMSSTPSGSINPSSGILVNNNTIFGQPPDYDEDGKTDILLYDIGGGSGNVVGYVHSADVWPQAPPGEGNQADVLYIDPLFSMAIIATVAAHEYVHLINITSGFDETFLAEGYAGYGEVLNGYGFWRQINYLRRIFQQQKDYELPFFTWRPGGGTSVQDYQRGNHFFTYAAEQYDPQLVGEMLQNTQKGTLGLNEILQQRGGELSDLIMNFHAANMINDGSVDPRFVHLEPGRGNLGTLVTISVDGEQFSQTVHPGREIEAGSVLYVEWSDVADFSFSFDAVGFEGICENPGTFCESEKATLRRPLKAVVIGMRPDFSEPIWEIIPQEENYVFNGRFTTLRLILSHTDPSRTFDRTSTIPEVKFTATWTPLSLVTDTETSMPLPQTFALNQNYPNPFNPRTVIPFQMDRTGPATLSVYDMLGRRVAVLVDEVLPAGSYEHVIDASAWPSGTYVMRLERDGDQITRLMHLIK